VSPLTRPPWSAFLEEFCCRRCGGGEAFRSRPRGFFEKHLLPFIMMQPVRCERCDHRRYIWSTIPVLERAQPGRKPATGQSSESSETGGRVA
jgi:hypothetical protein